MTAGLRIVHHPGGLTRHKITMRVRQIILRDALETSRQQVYAELSRLLLEGDEPR